MKDEEGMGKGEGGWGIEGGEVWCEVLVWMDWEGEGER